MNNFIHKICNAGYDKFVRRCPDKSLSVISNFGQIYFINYKNSAVGTGGVGTVTREMVELFPEMHYVYYDSTQKVGLVDEYRYNVPLTRKEADYLHSMYAKLHLWPVLHGLESNLRDDSTKNEFLRTSEQAVRKFAQTAWKFASRSSDSRRRIYWVNDYALAPVVRYLRDLDCDAHIIFSLRTPFGTQRPPNLTDYDINFVVDSILQASLVTFHRLNDMNNFIEIARPRVIDIQRVGRLEYIVLTSLGQTTLRVVPMGGNYANRQNLSLNPQSIVAEKQWSEFVENRKLIVGVSRFEKTKGIEYELHVVERMMELYPESVGTFNFVRFSYMSNKKRDMDYYISYRNHINSEVDRINSKFGRNDWQPITPMLDYKLSDEEVTGILRAADVLFIGSYADGFNHLAQEGVFSHSKGVVPLRLVLTDIGATDYLYGHFACDCTSIQSGAVSLHKALISSTAEAWIRMLGLQLARRYTARRWITDILYRTIKIN